MGKGITISPSNKRYTYDHQSIKASILEMRRIYANLTEAQFISMYAKKVRMPKSEIKEILEASA